MMKIKISTVLIAAALMFGLAPAAAADDDWHFGIGTGFFTLNVEGDSGLATALAGPVEFDPSMSFDEINEVLESAFGLGGFAAKGKWTFGYSAGRMELEDTLTGTAGPLAASATITFTATVAEGTVSYRFALKGKHAWAFLSGLRYTKHEFDLNITAGAMAPFLRSIDHDWTDVLVGLTHGTQLSDKWSWSTRIDGGFGGSEGTFFFNTGFNRSFAKRWVFTLYGQVTSIDFEEDTRADPDWYFYDADEFGVGANVAVTW